MNTHTDTIQSDQNRNRVIYTFDIPTQDQFQKWRAELGKSNNPRISKLEAQDNLQAKCCEVTRYITIGGYIQSDNPMHFDDKGCYYDRIGFNGETYYHYREYISSRSSDKS